jgi:biotin/methionine sulfoxide reductase
MVNYAIQRADHGEQPIWMSVLLAAMAGSMGRPGCGWGAGYLTMDATGVAPGRPPVASVPRVPNPVPDFIPVARIADNLLHPGRTIDYDGRRLTLPELRLFYWCGGNPFHHHQDLHRLTRAWQMPDTVVVHEAWWTTTAKFADIVLPVATSLERDDFAAGFSDPHLTAMPKVREPAGESRTDHQIFAALASRLGYEREFTQDRSETEWVRHLGRHGAGAAALQARHGNGAGVSGDRGRGRASARCDRDGRRAGRMGRRGAPRLQVVAEPACPARCRCGPGI